ncbi:hypothetical protein JIN87_27615 [Pelagicoccus mobilis]|uniref:Uncharacterized protein n=1 Tax=Pelagicoccus mobilis TaxID=415221 RepID=A0A934S4P5_9BACT|nr:hypothetical protein [Pelagicoccus mobilis]
MPVPPVKTTETMILDTVISEVAIVIKEELNKTVDTTAANARLFHIDHSKSTNSDVDAMTEAAVVSP